jgi:multicomponent Na+:H+ antiporter subunit D
MSRHAPVLMIVVPLLSSLVVLLAGLWRKRLGYPLALAALAASLIAAFSILFTVMETGRISYRLGGWAPPWGIEYALDHLNAFIAVIVSFISLLVAVYSRRSIEREAPDKVVYFYPIYLLLVTGLLGIVATGDIFNLYVFLEISSLAAYALIAIGSDKRAPLSSFNYVIMGTIGACFYLLGVGYLYIMTGSLNMADLARLLPPLYHSRVVLVAFAFFVVGVGVKIALFPLHGWLPNAYTHAPSAVSALVASTMTKVGVYVMIRIMFTVFNPSFSTEIIPMASILGWVAAAAALFGCVMALSQTDFKRMLTYVLIAEVGYIVIGISAANRAGMTGAILHILNDAFMMACLFLAAGAVVYKQKSAEISHMNGLYKKMPLTMASIAIAGISVVGVPPTAGFFSKWYLVLGAIRAGQWQFAAVLLASSLMTAIIFFRILEQIYFKPNPAPAPSGGQDNSRTRIDDIPASMLAPILITAAGILGFGFMSGTIVSRVIQYAVPVGW